MSLKIKQADEFGTAPAEYPDEKIEEYAHQYASEMLVAEALALPGEEIIPPEYPIPKPPETPEKKRRRMRGLLSQTAGLVAAVIVTVAVLTSSGVIEVPLFPGSHSSQHSDDPALPVGPDVTDDPQDDPHGVQPDDPMDVCSHGKIFVDYLGDRLSFVQMLLGTPSDRISLDGESCEGLGYYLDGCRLEFWPSEEGTDEEAATVGEIWFTDPSGIECYGVTESYLTDMNYADALAALQKDGYAVEEGTHDDGVGLSVYLDATKDGVRVLLQWSSHTNNYFRGTEGAATSIMIQG